MRLAGLALTGALALLATDAAARRGDPLAGRIAGTPRDCLSIDRVQGPDIAGGHTIIYRQNHARWWVTHPIGACPSLERNPVTLIVDVHGGRICRNDRFRVKSVDSIIPGASCRFGAFTPYDLSPKSADFRRR